MFTDFIRIKLSAGNGGNGVVSWRREKYIPKGGPCGGDGGTGGSVIIQADHGLFSLESLRNKRHLAAKNGGQGGPNNRKGKNGGDLIIKVPPGTLVKNPVTQEILYDFTKDLEEWEICTGGVGGKGNTHFKSSTNQAPNTCTPGKEGDSTEIEFELKLIADVGFVGMPNAGKSTLMSDITKVPVKIAPYPFTTLNPNLGIVEFEDYSRVLIADIPGIIAEAHADKGLGLSFLKHIERTQVLIFVVDIAAWEGRDPYEDFQTLLNELNSYNSEMTKKPFLVVLNKTDLEGARENENKFREKYTFPKETLFSLSALTQDGIDTFLEAMRKLSQKDGKRYI